MRTALLRALASRRGIGIPMVLLLLLLVMSSLALMVSQMQDFAVKRVQVQKNVEGKTLANAGVQLALARLEKRLSLLPARIDNGIPLSGGGTRYLTDTDVASFLAAPSGLWSTALNEISGEPDFSAEDADTARLFWSEDIYDIEVRLEKFAAYQEPGTSGYNDVHLQYRYRVYVSETKTGYGKSVEVVSFTNPNRLIEVALLRDLSSYNLFAEFNTTPSGSPIYDKSTYNGPVYTKNTFYLQGPSCPGPGTNVWDGPHFNDIVRIADSASPQYTYRTYNGTACGSFTFKNTSNGTVTPETVAAISMPGSLQEDAQKALAYWGSEGVSLPGGLTPGVYSDETRRVLPAPEGSRYVPTMAYVKGDAEISVTTRAANHLNYYVISSPTGEFEPKAIEQDLHVLPHFLIYVDGNASFYAQLSTGTRLTLSAKDNIVLTGSVQYDTVGVRNTVAGLVSWNGHVVVSKDAATTASAAVPPSDTVWVEDSVPAGATTGTSGADTWNWVGSNPAPQSGSLAMQSAIDGNLHQVYFYSSPQTLTLTDDDILFAYVYLDPAHVPSMVMLQFYDGGWEHRAYWGTTDASFVWGTEGTASRLPRGSLPAAGQWVRLEVPASAVNLANRTLSGMAFTLFGGRATWDRAGKVASQSQSPGGAASVNVQAVLMTPKGGFGAEGWESMDSNYSSYRGVIYHTGSIIRKYGLPTLNTTFTKGWGLITQYDPYLKNTKAPPYFPGNGPYKLGTSTRLGVVDLYYSL